MNLHCDLHNFKPSVYVYSLMTTETLGSTAVGTSPYQQSDLLILSVSALPFQAVHSLPLITPARLS